MREFKVEQGSIEWHKLRAGIVTGTSLKQAVSKNWRTLMYELISERMTEPQISDFYSKDVERGKELEPIARIKYSEKTGIGFETTGMLFPDHTDGFGISPDAIYRSDDLITGGLEIKCPSSKKHVEYLIKNKVPAEYRYQVLAPFVADNCIEWWDFISYDDRNYENPIFSIRTHRDDVIDEVKEIRLDLMKFIDKVDQEHTALTF